MATYKKRGYKPEKPKTEVEKEEVFEGESTTAEVFNTLDAGASRTEEFVEKNQKIILGVVGVVAIAVLAYLGYQQFIQGPKEVEATNEIYQAQKYYEEALTATANDSLYTLALQGGEGKFGFLDIIDNYGGTDAGNMAKYYAGVSYLNLKQYQQAIEYLDQFKAEDMMLGPVAKGAIGDAFIQLEQPEDALKYYEAAATMNDNEFTTPRFLLKAGTTALSLGKTDVAVKHLETIVEKYATSAEVTKAEAYLGKAKGI